MSVIVFCNIGNRDIEVQTEHGTRPPARQHGSQLLARFEDLKGELRFPILGPALEYIRSQHDGKIGTVILFGTDQPDDGSVDVRNVPFRDKDTFNYAQVAQRYLKQQYGGGAIGKIGIKAVSINPSMYDEAFDAYGSLIAPYVGDDVEACYLIAVGGTPACNTALLLQGVRLFGERCRTVYVPENRQPHEMQTGLQVFNVLRENTAVTMLQRQDFTAAALLMHAFVTDRALVALAEYGAARIAFDFEQAQAHLQNVLNWGRGAVRAEAQRARTVLQPLLDGDDKALIAEVAHNARICWENGRYVDFLGRVFRFEEAVLRYVISLYFDGLPTDEGSKEAKQQLAAYIDAHPDLKAFLSAQKPGGQPLNFTIINRTVLKALLQYVIQSADSVFTSATRTQAALLQEILNRMGALSTLRNKSIVAHGYAGVSQERIMSSYVSAGSGNSPVDDLWQVCGALGIELNDPFRQTAKFIVGQLQRTG